MRKRIITAQLIQEYRTHLITEEKSPHTIEKYVRDVNGLAGFLKGQEVTKEEIMAYKERLKGQYAVRSINSMLASVNSFLKYCGWQECCVRQLRIQKQVFCPEEKELTKAEYRRLVETALWEKKDRLALAIETICGTGIRISELAFITAEAVRQGKAEVLCKGKCRQIFLPRKLQIKLRQYIRMRRIWNGPVFVTRTGKVWDRSDIWKEMKKLCQAARVAPQKVFPHNLRHLFARTYYALEKDIARLADILGHSSLSTTRIYIVSTGREHQKQISALGLVV